MRPTIDPHRHSQRWLLWLAAAALAWCLTLSVSGGFDTRLLGHAFTAHDVVRPLDAAAVLLALHLWLTRRQGSVDGPASSLALPAFSAWGASVVLAVLVGAVGVIHGVRTASASDSYGYLSQAELWRAGRLQIDMPLAKDAPWPDALRTFSPLAYRPNDVDAQHPSIVPTYAPGLPIMLATAKSIGGQAAMFWVVPIFGVMLVLATFSLSQRLASSSAGLIGAWLVATSTAVLYTTTVTMTDVPVAALWTMALLAALRTSPSAALGAGVLSGIALLVRPNLLPLAAIVWLLCVVPGSTSRTRARAMRRSLMFAAGVLPWMAGVALVNAALYGSALASGYGPLSNLFSLAHVWPNLLLYTQWLKETQTVLVYLGVLAIAWPRCAWWGDRRDTLTFVVIQTFVAVLFAFYLFYEEFDSWKYLRFLLPAWPLLMIGTGVIATRLMLHGDRAVRALVIMFVVTLGAAQWRIAVQHGAFEQRDLEKRFAALGTAIDRLTPANSVIVSMQHSGSVRYYSGRMTLRYDFMDPQWIDPAIDWLTMRGMHTYLLIEDWEQPAVEARFPGSRLVTALQSPPVAIYDDRGKLTLYDLSAPRPPGATPEHLSGDHLDLAAIQPVPLKPPIGLP